MKITENFKHSDFIETIEKASLINPNKKHFIEKFHCPSCNRAYPEDFPEHGVKFKCKCGLEMLRYGNSLRCKLDRKLLRLQKLKRITKT